MPPDRGPIHRRALRVNQSARVPLYLFSLTTEELLGIADISRLSRNEAGRLIGYQRPEVKRHIQNITEYLNSDDVLFPNAIILALTSASKFTGSRGPGVDDGIATSGTIEIPRVVDGHAKPAWVVDGQQRMAALAKCRRRDLAVPVTAFVADDLDTQRDQFMRVNSSRPLPQRLITELLPDVSTVLPANLAVRRAPAAICDTLNRDKASPFFGLIRRPSDPPSARRVAMVADTSIVKMIQSSLSQSGCLFHYRNVATNETDYDSVREVLILYWSAVRDTFPRAWGLPPTKSRLLHGVGIAAMGRVMDRIMASVDIRDRRAAELVRSELARLRPVCRWTSGVWEDMGNIPWNALQNTGGHIKLLSNYLLRAYRETRRARVPA